MVDLLVSTVATLKVKSRYSELIRAEGFLRSTEISVQQIFSIAYSCALSDLTHESNVLLCDCAVEYCLLLQPTFQMLPVFDIFAFRIRLTFLMQHQCSNSIQSRLRSWWLHTSGLGRLPLRQILYERRSGRPSRHFQCFPSGLRQGGLTKFATVVACFIRPISQVSQ